MLPASNRGAGMNMGFPDVCNTPAGPATVPIPYPNIAMNAMAVPFSPNVFVSMMNGLNKASQIPMTSGDEGGVAHPTIKGPSTYTMGSPIVKMNMMPAIHLGCPTTGNNMNDALGAVLVPSITTVFFTRATDPATSVSAAAFAAELEGDTVERLAGPAGSVTARVRCFAFHTPTELADAIDGATSVCLDLRGNAGGDVASALRVIDLFVPAGALVGRLVEADGDERDLVARSGPRCVVPLTIRVDEGTASAAELVAGSLRAIGRARIVGERTYGKATVHAFVDAPDGAPSYAQVGVCRLPDGTTWQGVGLRPDEP